MKTVKLIPPDLKQCQAQIRDATFMSLGGDCTKLRRCESKPAFIAYENEPASDGQKGSMSLCEKCKDAMLKQLGHAFATIVPISTAKRIARNGMKA